MSESEGTPKRGPTREFLRFRAGVVYTTDPRGLTIETLAELEEFREIPIGTLRGWCTRYVKLVLYRCGNNKRAACRALDISYHTLQGYLCRPVGNRRKNAPSMGEVAPAFLTAPGLVRERGEFGATERTVVPGHR